MFECYVVSYASNNKHQTNVECVWERPAQVFKIFWLFLVSRVNMIEISYMIIFEKKNIHFDIVYDIHISSIYYEENNYGLGFFWKNKIK